MWKFSDGESETVVRSVELVQVAEFGERFDVRDFLVIESSFSRDGESVDRGRLMGKCR